MATPGAKRLDEPIRGAGLPWYDRFYIFLTGRPRAKQLDPPALPVGAKIYITLIALAGAAAATALIWWSWGASVEEWWLFAVFALLVVLDQTSQMHFLRVQEGLSLKLEEAYLMAMALLFPPHAIVLSFLGASLIGVVIRRGHPVRSIFNLGQLALATSASLAFMHAVGLDPQEPFTFRNLVAIILGGALFFMISSSAVAGVLSFVEQRPFRFELGKDFSEMAFFISASLSAGLLLGVVALAYPWALPVALAAMFMLMVTLSSRLKAIRDRERMLALLEATERMHASSIPQEVERAVLSVTEEFLRPKTTEILPTPPPEPPAEGPFREQMAAPLTLSQETRWLVVTGKRGVDYYTVADQRLLEAIAKIGGSALTNAHSFDRVADERRKLADVLNFSSDGIYSTDAEGQVISWNPAIAALTGISLSEALGVKQEVLAASWPRYAPLLEPPTRTAPQVVTIAQDDETRSFSVASSRTPDGGQVVVVREDTARLELERLGTERVAEKMRAELVSTVSHELRTPLTSILGFSRFLLARDVDEESRRQYLKTIETEAERLSNLLNDFLDLQRVKEGRFTLVIEPFDLTALGAEVLALFARQSDAHTLRLESDGEVVVSGDRARLHQVVANLVSNAVKYSPQGGEVVVRVEAVEGVGRLEVEDHGLGIPEEARSSLFTKFFRVADEERRHIGGTGLGLALCREIIVAHGGRIDYESTLGEGSRFWFEVERVEA